MPINYSLNKEYFRKKAREYYHRDIEAKRLEARERYHNGNQKEVNRRSKLKRDYNLTIEDYNRLLIKQGGQCAICMRHQTLFKRPLSVDHDHILKRVRGLLCPDCNGGIGLLGDNPKILHRAIQYLRDHNASI